MLDQFINLFLMLVICHGNRPSTAGWSKILARPGSHSRNLMGQRFTVVMLTVFSQYADCKRRQTAAGVTFSALQSSVTARCFILVDIPP